jgi:hypothetical protein
MPGIDFNRLRTEIAMEQVLNLLGFAPTHRRGYQWHGYCPLHQSAINLCHELGREVPWIHRWQHRPASSINRERLEANTEQRQKRPPVL